MSTKQYVPAGLAALAFASHPLHHAVAAPCVEPTGQIACAPLEGTPIEVHQEEPEPGTRAPAVAANVGSATIMPLTGMLNMQPQRPTVVNSGFVYGPSMALLDAAAK